MQVDGGSKPREQRDREKSAGRASLFMVISSQVQPGPRRETAPRTTSEQAAGAAWGKRKLRGLGGSGAGRGRTTPGLGSWVQEELVPVDCQANFLLSEQPRGWFPRARRRALGLYFLLHHP